MENLEHGWIANNSEEADQEYCTCGWCGKSIYYGDDYYNLGFDEVCEDCIKDCRRTAED